VIILDGRNVNSLFYQGMNFLHVYGEDQDSRAGRVRVAPHPVVSVYQRPHERVLFDAARDANPFFHLMESLWMLAGRDDSAFLDNYVRDFGSRYAEDGIIHGAYGRRWRTALGFDQLDEVVRRLRVNPNDRQCVVQMWDGTSEIAGYNMVSVYRGYDDLLGDWKDRPCNTHVYLRVREETEQYPMPVVGATERTGTRVQKQVLDLTICCRSNDAVWGAHGANAVHFSVLQEYLAGCIGIGIGKMYQFSNNYHVYDTMREKLGELEYDSNPYVAGAVSATPMGTDWSAWDEDLKKFMEWHDSALETSTLTRNYFANPWFAEVAQPMALANWDWKHGFKSTARKVAEQIEATDWRRACIEWMDRRKKCES
jgi:thymidylate synthase